MLWKRKIQVPAPEPVTYRFEWQIGFKSGDPQDFWQHGWRDEGAAISRRNEVIAALRRAMESSGVVGLDENLFVRGEEVAWFLVREVRVEP